MLYNLHTSSLPSLNSTRSSMAYNLRPRKRPPPSPSPLPRRAQKPKKESAQAVPKADSLLEQPADPLPDGDGASLKAEESLPRHPPPLQTTQEMSESPVVRLPKDKKEKVPEPPFCRLPKDLLGEIWRYIPDTLLWLNCRPVCRGFRDDVDSYMQRNYFAGRTFPGMATTYEPRTRPRHRRSTGDIVIGDNVIDCTFSRFCDKGEMAFFMLRFGCPDYTFESERHEAEDRESFPDWQRCCDWDRLLGTFVETIWGQMGWLAPLEERFGTRMDWKWSPMEERYLLGPEKSYYSPRNWQPFCRLLHDQVWEVSVQWRRFLSLALLGRKVSFVNCVLYRPEEKVEWLVPTPWRLSVRVRGLPSATPSAAENIRIVEGNGLLSSQVNAIVNMEPASFRPSGKWWSWKRDKQRIQDRYRREPEVGTGPPQEIPLPLTRR